MNRKIVLLSIVGFVALGGCFPGAPKKANEKEQKVEKGDVSIQVIETGTLQAVKSVEVKSRVSGRVKKLYFDEGDIVRAGDLIAEIDPQETQLQVEQNSAQVRGAEAGARRQSIEIAQRRVTAANALAKARSNLRQLEMELKIQPTLTKSTVSSAQSAYDQAVQAYDQLVNITQPNGRTSTANALRDARNSLKTAQNEAARMDRLLEQGYVAKRDTENAQLQVQLAESKLQSAEENMNRLESSYKLDRDQASERVKQAKSQLDQSKANTIQDLVKREQYLRAQREVSDAQAAMRDVQALQAGQSQQLASISQLRSVLSDGQRQLGETRILAPITGIITKRFVQIGELVSSLNSFSAGTTIFRIEDRSRMIVQLAINEIDVAKLRDNTRAEIKVDALPKDTFNGKVTKISPASTSVGQATAQTVSADAVVKYQVEVTLDDNNGKLKSGMSAKCTMKVLDRKGVLRLPLEFIGKDDKGDFIMLPPKNPKDPKDKGTRVEVEVGDQSSTMAEIKSGVKEGQVVVKPEFKGPKRKGMMDFSVKDE